MKAGHVLAGLAAGALLLVGAGAGGAEARTSGSTTKAAIAKSATGFDTYYFTNGALCLDADYGTLHDKSTKVQMWACNSTSHQHWVFHLVDAGLSTYTITNVGADNKCLDADSGTINHNGTIVHLYPCNNWEGQQWGIYPTSNADVYVLQNEASGRYLDAATEKAGQNGDPVQLWDPSPGGSQRWQFPQP
jgi:hypothetical protein